METPNIIWIKNGRILKQADSTITTMPNLEKKVYNMNFDGMKNEIYLEEFANDFHFDFKVYGTESNLINHIMKTFENTKGNLGILFNGTKGTGKTITAKIIANKTNLPVILITEPYPGIADFISKINCPCVIFFDEFEKTFDTNRKQDIDVLAIMDGVYNSPYRRVFLLTTNKLYINENLIGRPSRIRFKKSFGNLAPEVIKEYLDDNLKYPQFAKDIMEFIDSLSISTIDILKSIVEEVNIHGVSVNEFKNFLNVEQAKYTYVCQIKYASPNYTLDDYKADLAKIGTKDKDEDGEEYIVDEDDLDINTRRISTPSMVEYMFTGEDFGNYGKITTPMNKEGFIITEDEYDRTWYIKIKNIKSKPSLYRGGLDYAY